MWELGEEEVGTKLDEFILGPRPFNQHSAEPEGNNNGEDDKVQQRSGHSHKFGNLTESVRYFLDEIDRIVAAGEEKSSIYYMTSSSIYR